MDNIQPRKDTPIEPAHKDANKENVPNLGKPAPLASEALKHPDDIILPKSSLFQHKVEQAPADPKGPHLGEPIAKNSPLSKEEHEKLEALVGIDALNNTSPDELLLEAAKKGNTEAVSLLLKLGADINTTDKRGNTPLHNAAEKGDLELVKLLSKQPGVDLNKANRLLRTPLHNAAAKGHAEVVSHMLSMGGIDASLNAQDKLRGASPLHLAAAAGHTEVIKCFIKAHDEGAGIDFNLTNKNGETALSFAISKGQEDACIALIESGKTDPNIPNQNGHTALHKAVTGNNTRIAEALLKGPIPADANMATSGGSTPLHIAVDSGNLDMVKLLTSIEGIDTNSVDLSQNTPLHRAAEKGHPEIITHLIQEGSAEVNATSKDGNTPLHLAAAMENMEATKALLEAGDIQASSVNLDGISPLSAAKMTANTEICDLIEAATDPKAENLIHETKLMGHRFNLDNVSNENKPNYQLEGYGQYYTNKELGAHWDSFIESPFAEGFWADNQSELKEYFAPLNEQWKDTRTFNSAKTAEAIKNGTPCSIPGSFPSHYISMSIKGDVLCINNRGYQTQKGKGIDEETIGLRFINIADHKETFTEEFIDRLHRGDVRALRELYQMPTLYQHNRTPQKRGNCTLTQAKADRQAHMIYFAAETMGIDLTQADSETWKSAIEQADPLYTDFALHDRTEGLKNYEALDSETPYYEAILDEGQSELDRLAAKQNGHYNILQNAGAIT